MSRIKWYHFYILLASFDVIVIAVGWVLHRKTLDSFSELLAKTAPVDARQRDLAALGQRVLAANAPGNDVFQTRNVAAERDRFLRLRADLLALKRTYHFEPDELVEFWKATENMFNAELRIFDLLGHADDSATGSPTRQADLVGASAEMAQMDKHQARALRQLADQQEVQLAQSAEMLWEYKSILVSQSNAQQVFLPVLAVALVGMLWFGRKLQKTDESLNAERQRVATERRERLASIGELCSAVAHGIQNPLAAIRSSAELVLDMGEIDGQSRARAQDVIRECDRLSQRVRRLLNFARTEGQPRDAIDLGEAIDQVIDELRPHSDQLRIRICRAEGCGRGVRVLASGDEIATVLIELLSNALDHAPAGSEVRVRTALENGRVSLEISDDGPGVPPGMVAHIFDLFYSTKPEGTGIGLTSARRIVESLGGEMEYVDRAGGGATFRVRLTAVAARGGGQGLRAAPVPPPALAEPGGG